LNTPLQVVKGLSDVNILQATLKEKKKKKTVRSFMMIKASITGLFTASVNK